MTTGDQSKIQTRTASMRHTATLEVELQYAKERALLGTNFAGDIESLLDWQHMGAEWLCAEITKLLDARKVALKAASEQRGKLGAGVDAAQFSDEAATASSVFTGSDEDRHTVIAALRFWQQNGMCDPYKRCDTFQDLATNGDELTSLCDEDVDALVECLNC